MSRKIFVAIFLIAMLLAPVSVVSAKLQPNGEYIVTPASNAQPSTDFKILSYDTITQGETDWYSSYVPPGTTGVEVDLNWGDVSDSLTLTIYTPDGYTLGPYYDSSDGKTDGRIHLYIQKASGYVASGTWYFKVYGDNIYGTEDYTINVYTY